MTEAETDFAIAKELFGWKERDGQLMPPGYFIARGKTSSRMTPPNYSSDRVQAQKVWERMAEMGDVKFERFLAEMPSLVAGKAVVGQTNRQPGGMVAAQEICSAALKALSTKS